MMNKKGETFDIFTFMVFAFLVVVLFAGWIYITGKLNDVFHQVGLNNEVNSGNAGYVNMTQASDQVFGQMNAGIQALKMVALVYILAYGACLILVGALVRKSPLWFFAYILISILAVVFAPTISNAYENLLNSNIYEGGLISFTGANFLLLNLPSVVLVVAILGGVLVFVNMIRSSGEASPL